MTVFDKKTFKRTILRTLALQGCFNYERQQAVGFLYGIIPALEKIYKDDKEGLNEALLRHTAFFNTTPQMSPFITGTIVAMEEQNAKLFVVH